MLIFIMTTQSYSPHTHPCTRLAGPPLFWDLIGLMGPVAARSAAAVGSGVATVGIEPRDHQSRRSHLVFTRVLSPPVIPPAGDAYPCSRCGFGWLGTVPGPPVPWSLSIHPRVRPPCSFALPPPYPLPSTTPTSTHMVYQHTSTDSRHADSLNSPDTP